MDLGADAIIEYLDEPAWKTGFEDGVLVAGDKLSRSKLVRNVEGEFFETGDCEIRATVLEKDGAEFSVSLVFWVEDGAIVNDTDCHCDVKVRCSHAAALFHWLAKGKGARVRSAFGESPEVETVIESQSEVNLDQASATDRRSDAPAFILRVEKKSEDDPAWIPDVFARAYVQYGDKRLPLPAPLLSGGDGKVVRDFNVESQATGQLDSLGLIPGAEDGPQSLKKRPGNRFDAPLWAPDKKAFPHPRLFWQKFWVEWGPALERAGWEVRYDSNVQIKPIVFRTETWNAEIVEEGKGWFHLSAGFEVDGERFELQPILAALLKNRFLENTANKPPGQEFLVFLPDGRGIAVPIGRFRRILETLGELMDFRFTDGPIRLSKLDAAIVSSDAFAGNEESEFPLVVPPEVESLSARLGEEFKGIEPVPVPDGLEATLRDYQLVGYHWMQFLITMGLNGILADDMGLGKTLQTLTHLLAEKETGRNQGRPSLVVAPTSVVQNWQREGAKFAPGLSTLLLQGARRKELFERIPDFDVVLTSFALVYRDLEYLNRHEYHLVILDEAQHIKNPEAQTTRAVSRIESTHRLCLSGTPVENNLGELWSLMSFLMPGLLGSREFFQSAYRTPIEKNNSEARRNALVKRVGPLVLRRTKHDVASELPPKTEIVHPIELNEDQKDLYETVRSTMDRRVREALKLQGKENQMVFLEALLKLRQICCHPALLGKNESSAKFEFLVELIETLRAEKHRILIFSQFTSMISRIADHLEAEACPYLVLTGETRDRQTLVERFQSGEGEVFLISLKAGGTGLTLTGADRVIHYDPWWNPAVENQATDRAYRIGQDKPVFVHKLVCQGTVEDRIQEMQNRKANVASGLLEGATQGIGLTAETIEELLQPLV